MVRRHRTAEWKDTWKTISQLVDADGNVLAEISLFNGSWFCTKPDWVTRTGWNWDNRELAKVGVVARMHIAAKAAGAK